MTNTSPSMVWRYIQSADFHSVWVVMALLTVGKSNHFLSNGCYDDRASVDEVQVPTGALAVSPGTDCVSVIVGGTQLLNRTGVDDVNRLCIVSYCRPYADLFYSLNL